MKQGISGFGARTAVIASRSLRRRWRGKRRGGEKEGGGGWVGVSVGGRERESGVSVRADVFASSSAKVGLGGCGERGRQRDKQV